MCIGIEYVMYEIGIMLHFHCVIFPDEKLLATPSPMFVDLK